MPNDSATGGYLAPGVIAAPLEDQALEDFLHDVVAGITGIANDLVRPRWQEEPPNLPARNVDWVGQGIPNRRRDTFPVVQHDPDASAGAGADILIRHEELELLCSFYGPNCQAKATLLADGIFIPQNREVLATVGLKLKEAGEPTKAPELIKGRWYQRCDLAIWLRREIRRQYPVLNLLAATGEVITTAATRTLNVSP
jgi:hypothetical protein